MSEYAGHLANMQDKAKIVATEDILSDNGVLLAKSGIEFNKQTCEKILKFKLLKPLEDSIAIENQLNAKSIYNSIMQTVTKDPWLRVINDTLGNKVALQRCCLRVEKFPILEQKLTVLNIELPDIFEQAILSAYLCYICAITDNLAQEDIEHYFLAGITHDIGFLHINHATLKKQGDLTADEWRNIQSHPVIGYEMLKGMNQFPKVAARAVLEHHENLDGSGYPKNKTTAELDRLGQLVNLLDNVIAIYNKKLKTKGRSLRCVIPVLQINAHSYFPDVVSVIIRMLKKAPESTIKSSGISEVYDMVTHAKKSQAYVKKTMDIIVKTNQSLGYEHNNKDISAIQNIGNNINAIVNSAGLSDTSYTDSLTELITTGQENVHNEVEDVKVMLEEIIYQFQTYQKYVNSFTSKNPEHSLSPALNEGLKAIKSTPKPKPQSQSPQSKTG